MSTSYYERNKAERLRYQHEYNRKHLPQLLYHAAKQRATEKKVPFDLSPEDILVPEVCPVLGLALKKSVSGPPTDSSPTLDRFIPALGYVRGNVRVISRLANQIKSSATSAQVQAVADWMRKVESECPSRTP